MIHANTEERRDYGAYRRAKEVYTASPKEEAGREVKSRKQRVKRITKRK